MIHRECTPNIFVNLLADGTDGRTGRKGRTDGPDGTEGPDGRAGRDGRAARAGSSARGWNPLKLHALALRTLLSCTGAR